MILGVGTDLLDIRRLERTLDRWGDRFCRRVYTETERQSCDRRINRAARYAQRYAAKEACAKALGTGFRQGVAWRDMEVDNLPSGKPFLRLSGGATDADTGGLRCGNRALAHRRVSLRACNRRHLGFA